MSGKINIVFGFFYLAFTAVLGPAFLVPQFGARGAAMAKAGEAVTAAQTTDASSAQKTAVALSSLMDALKAQQINGKGAHSHGNLEALLNIVAGFILLSLAIPGAFKKLLTLMFIVGALFHSGILYLGAVFGVMAAFKFIIIGEVSLIGGLVLMGVAVAMGIKGKDGCR
ncbi:MAG: hypothetical protein HY886_11035 [Deltaproteobacteria bacterium]|nr:hypothetical protein [Deltaproteobacteria bacterium]